MFLRKAVQMRNSLKCWCSVILMNCTKSAASRVNYVVFTDIKAIYLPVACPRWPVSFQAPFCAYSRIPIRLRKEYCKLGNFIILCFQSEINHGICHVLKSQIIIIMIIVSINEWYPWRSVKPQFDSDLTKKYLITNSTLSKCANNTKLRNPLSWKTKNTRLYIF